MYGVIVVSASSQRICRRLLYKKMSLIWVSLDACVHGEFEDGLGFYFWPWFSEAHQQKWLLKFMPKTWFFRGSIFHSITYFECTFVKTKAFWKIFFTKILIIKSSTNAANCIKIGLYYWIHTYYLKRYIMLKNGLFHPILFQEI
jgi:hypothetical protein